MVVVLGWLLELMILEVISNPNDSMNSIDSQRKKNIL